MSASDDIPVDPSSKRQRIAAICANPGLWKVCEGCESVVGVVFDFCPRCHAYRFDRDKKRVIAAAKAAAKRPAEDLPSL